MNLQIPKEVGNFMTSWATVSVSWNTVFHGVSSKKTLYHKHSHLFAWNFTSTVSNTCAKPRNYRRRHENTAFTFSHQNSAHPLTRPQLDVTSKSVPLHKWWLNMSDMWTGTCSESFVSTFEMLPDLMYWFTVSTNARKTDMTVQLCPQKNATDQRHLLYTYILITCLLLARFLY
jgi:hypothetical protein